MQRRSADEALNEYQARFGEANGFLVKGLTDRVSDLYDEWRLFIYLFGENKERVLLLKQSSGLMFETIQRTLWGSVLIKIRHLTDPAETMRKQKNFSLEWLKRVAQERGESEFVGHWESVLADCKPVRRHVDKYIAHLDDRHARGDAVATLNRKETTVAVKSIGAFVQRFQEIMCETTMVLLPTHQEPSHQHVLHLLHLGNQKQKENDELLNRDWKLLKTDDHEIPEYLVDDFDWSDPF